MKKMETAQSLNYLAIPLFSLYNFKQLDEIIFREGDVEYLKKGYDLGDRKSIHEALAWAKDHPNFEFETVMENAPVVGKLPFSNSEFYNYLMKFKTFMEEDNGLLSEESNPKF